MENTYASKHFFFYKKYLSYNQNLTAICSGYTLPAGYAKISMPYTYEPLPYGAIHPWLRQYPYSSYCASS